MAWFGESLANITGQISNFTKEVLTESRDGDEDSVDAGDTGAAHKRIQELQDLCGTQKQEIERLRIANLETLDRAEEQERQVQHRVEEVQQLLQNKEEENKLLRQQIDSLLQQRDERREDVTEAIEELKDADVAKKTELVCVATNTDERHDEEQSASIVNVAANVCDAAVGDGSVDENDNEELLDEKMELEERCNGYQNDLFLLREELMTLQHSLDEREIASTKLLQDVLSILSCEFHLDGQQVVKLKPPSHQFAPADEDVIISALKQLASIWKDLVDRKATLERTVAKLSTGSSPSPSVSSSTSPQHSPLCLTASVDQGDYSGGDFGNGTPKILPNTFLPPKVDSSFVLETILEDEGGEEDVQAIEEEEPESFLIADSASRSLELSAHVKSFSLVNNSSQTDELHVSAAGEEKIDQDLEKRKLEEHAAQEERIQVLLAEERSRAEQVLQRKLNEAKLESDSKAEELKLQVTERDEKIKKLEGDLDRLKNHLVELEEQATSEAVVSEEREKELRHQIAQLKAQIAQSLEEYDKIGDVREELNRLATELDAAKGQNSVYEDQIQKQGVQLQNLHFVLEQFQKEKETEIGNLEKMLRNEINQLMAEKEALSKEILAKEEALTKARSGLEAAQNLGMQIEEKAKIINSLKSEVQEKEQEIAKMDAEMKEVAASLDGKIDRYLVKNLIVGYFATPTDKRKEVLRVLATVLDFNREDRQKTGLEASSLWPFGRGDGSGENKQSLSEAFIRFLETESQPKVQVKMSMEEMARRPSRISIGGADSPVQNPASPGISGAVASSGNQSPEMSVSFPMLNQVDRSNSILKDVLNPKP